MEVDFPCRCADGDLAKERGAVMEEWRSGRDSVGRTHEAHWKILLEGTKVGHSLAISLPLCTARDLMLREMQGVS